MPVLIPAHLRWTSRHAPLDAFAGRQTGRNYRLPNAEPGSGDWSGILIFKDRKSAPFTAHRARRAEGQWGRLTPQGTGTLTFAATIPSLVRISGRVRPTRPGKEGQ